jgi:hypothetical protein
MLTFGLGIIILQGVSSRKYMAGVNIMALKVHSERQKSEKVVKFSLIRGRVEKVGI